MEAGSRLFLSLQGASSVLGSHFVKATNTLRPSIRRWGLCLPHTRARQRWLWVPAWLAGQALGAPTKNDSPEATMPRAHPKAPHGQCPHAALSRGERQTARWALRLPD